MTEELSRQRPGWVKGLDVAAGALAVLACLIFLTGGRRLWIAGIRISVTSFGRAALAAFVLAIVRRLAWRKQPVALTLRGYRETLRRWARSTVAERDAIVPITACVLFYVVNNTIWLAQDGSSPSFDRAAHALFGLRFLRLFQHPEYLTLVQLLDVTNYWPPFFHLCSVPFTMALGFSVETMATANFLFLLVLVFSVYRIGERLFDRRTGVGAVVLTLLFPMVYALSREVLVDFALIAMVALSLDCVLATDAGLAPRRGVLLGVVFGCAMLTKWTAVTFVAGPAVFWLIVCLRRTRPPLRVVTGSLGLAALAAACVALPWYLHSLDTFREGAAVALGSDPVREGDPSRVIESVLYYWRAVPGTLVMKPLLFPTLLGLTAFLVRVRVWTGWGFLLSSIVPAAVFYVLIPNKDPRFVAPLLPLVALIAAAGLRRLPFRPVRLAVWLFIVAAGVWQFYAVSFGFPVQASHFYTHPPQRSDWKVKAILDAVSRIPASHPVRVAVLPDGMDLEQNIFILDAAIDSLPVEINGFGYRPERVESLLRYDVLVSKTGSIGVAHTARYRLAFREALAEWMRQGKREPQVTLWRTWPLPDGSVAEAYAIHAGDDPR